MTEREMSRNAARRLAIIRHAEEVTGNVSQTCRYFGITRQTFYIWLRRFEEKGLRMLDGVVIDQAELFNDKLQEWEDFYNFNRPHGGLGGQTPYERLRQKTTSPV